MSDIGTERPGVQEPSVSAMASPSRDPWRQPARRGQATERNRRAGDVVEPGELILGYRDSAGYIAPAITLSAESDPGDDLETDTPDFPSRFPRFAGSQGADLRDFGRNGTFVALRQLEQHVGDFEKFLGEAEDRAWHLSRPRESRHRRRHHA